jgi:peptidoglycan/xylan/chitin deacetylase (PgdA/CDA1 family)
MQKAFTALMGFGLIGSTALVFPFAALGWVRRASPDVVFSVDTEERVVALTIDDGPSDATGEILQVLDQYDARATFFLIGKHVVNAPETVRTLVSAGHEIGHHMMSNEPSIRLPVEKFRSQFDELDGILSEFDTVQWFRPGSGWFNQRMIRDVSSRGYRLVLGSIYSFDAQLPFPNFHSWFVLRNVAPGSIVVLHDGPNRGRRTATALRRILPALRQQGYRVVPVGELLSAPDPEPPR